MPRIPKIKEERRIGFKTWPPDDMTAVFDLRLAKVNPDCNKLRQLCSPNEFRSKFELVMISHRFFLLQFFEGSYIARYNCESLVNYFGHNQLRAILLFVFVE